MSPADNILFEIAEKFDLGATVMSVVPHGSGNVNDTFLINTGAVKKDKAILQRVNPHVFSNPEKIIDNMRMAAVHIQSQLSIADQPSAELWEFPGIIPTKSGSHFYRDQQGEYWRIIEYIEDTVTFETIENVHCAEQVGYALGKFHRFLLDLDTSKLHETLPGFHITPRYLSQFDQVNTQNPVFKKSPELQYCCTFVQNRRHMVDVLESAKRNKQIFRHPVHGDPKLNNFLFNKKTLKAVGLIDLDTIQPGLLLYDIGDCLRSCCNLEGEESNHPEKVRFEIEICQAILTHYFKEMQDLSAQNERALIFDAARLISFELGLRFFIDYLEGDVYFKTSHPLHNLQRALIQFKLTESIEAQEAVIRSITSPG